MPSTVQMKSGLHSFVKFWGGFDAGPKGDNEWERREAEKEDDRMFKVYYLHEILSKQDVIIFDKETIRQDLEYDPNRDTSVEALIMDGSIR